MTTEVEQKASVSRYNRRRLEAVEPSVLFSGHTLVQHVGPNG